MRTAEATRCPHLYRDTYWGNFRMDRNAAAITPEIIHNRDAFAEAWRLRRLVGSVSHYPARGKGEDFDHPETYRDADGWVVLVVSNYNAPPPRLRGMVRIAPIYSTAAESYAGRFASMKELRARLEACGGGKRPFGVALGGGGAAQGRGRAGASRGNLTPMRVLRDNPPASAAHVVNPRNSIGFPTMNKGNQS